MKSIRIGLILLLVAILIFPLGGYRFTPLAAAKANSFVTNDYELIGEYRINASIFYLFKSDKKQEYRAVYVKEQELIYRSNSSTVFPSSEGSLQTIGGMSIRNEDETSTLLVVYSNDEEVDYITINSELHTEKKSIAKNDIAYFLLPFGKQIDELNVTAYDKHGNKLFHYGYEKDSVANLKWHKVD